MSDATNKLISRLKQEFDELRLQLALGKTEAVDFLEKQKEQLKVRAEEAKAHVEKNPLIDEATTNFLKGRLDELRLQLALGKMETRDAVAEQQPKIEKALESVKEGMAPLREKAGDAFKEFSDLFEHGTDFFKTKLDALGVNLGLNEKAEALEQEVEAAETEPNAAKKQALEKNLEELSNKAKQATELAEGELQKLGDELAASFSKIRSELAKILKDE